MNRVKPVNHVYLSGKDREYEYHFKNVVFDELEEDMLDINGATLRWDGEYNGFVYQYKDRTPIIIKPDGCYVDKDQVSKDAEKQCYHCLSILDSMGLVRSFRQK